MRITEEARKLEAREILQKVTAMLVVFVMVLAEFSLVGSYAIDMALTNNENVEFVAYFENAEGEKVKEISSVVGTEGLKLKVDISVGNKSGLGGYFDGTISLKDANFKLKEEIGEIHVDAGNTQTIEREIEFVNKEVIESGYMNTESLLEISGTYKNSKKDYDITGEASVKVNWVSDESISSSLVAKILTNSTYKVEEANKKLVQVLVESKIENNAYPVKNTKIELSVPAGVEEVKVHKRTTSATNGDKDFGESNYSYNAETGMLTINVANGTSTGDVTDAEESAEQQLAWAKNAKDTFVVSYIYGENVNLEGKEIAVNSTITTLDEKELKAERAAKIEEEKDGIVTTSIEVKEASIYKGKIYTGEERDYETETIVNIDYTEAVENLKITENKPVFVVEKEATEDTEASKEEKTANIEIAQTKVNKEEFIKIFGESGFITIQDQEGNVVGNITKDSETDEEGNVVVKYSTGVTKLTIETSKPQTNGILRLNHTKKILDSKLEREEVRELVGIKNSAKVEFTKISTETDSTDKKTTTGTANTSKEIELKETESKASISLENKTLSVSEDEQDLQMTVVLDSSDESKDLYKNPTITITLPSQITSMTAKCKILYGNGLELEKATATKVNGKEVITIKLKGEQEKYPEEAVNGARILVYAKVKLDELATNATEEICVNYTNEYTDKQGECKTEVKIVSENKMILTNNIEANNTETHNLATEENNTTIKMAENDIENTQVTQYITSTVGGEKINENDIVYSGEIITYTVILENSGKVDISGGTLTASVPEGTTLIEVNEEYQNYGDDEESDGTKEEYFIEKSDTEVRFENISINVGKRVSYSYSVIINSDVKENENIQNITKFVCGNGDYESIDTISYVVKSAKIKLEMKRVQVGARYNEDGNLTARESYYYNLVVKNTSSEKIENLKVTIKQNGMMNIQEIYDIDKAEEETDEVVDFGIEFDEDGTFTIEEIEASKTKNIMIIAKIKPPTDENDSVKVWAIAKNSDENVYRSNVITEGISGPVIDFTLKTSTSSSNDTGIVHSYDEIIYTITAKNVGKEDVSSLEIRDTLSWYLNLESLTLNGKETNNYYMDIPFEDNGEEAKYTYIILETPLAIGETVEIVITTKVDLIYAGEIIEIPNKAFARENGLQLAETEKICYYLESRSLDEVYLGDDITTGTGTGTNTDNNDDININYNNGGSGSTTSNYSITGIAYLDENSNGSKDSDEKVLSGIKAYLIDVTSNEIVKNSLGNEISSTTNESGRYTLSDIRQGSYLVVFEYDTDKYTVTKYHADGVSSTNNSDVVTSTIKIDGVEKKVAASDKIDLKSSMANINMGLIEIKKFDLELEKVVSKITVTNKSGTTTKVFDDTDLAKVEIAAKYLKGSKVVIEYKIKIKNNGDTAGYVKNVVDYLPSSLSFSSSMNTNWYKKGDYIYNESLADTKIEKGETKELTLILTKTMTESNTGVVNNRAEIAEAESTSGLDDMDSTPGNMKKEEDDFGSADVIIGVKTGAAISYITLTIIIVLMVVGVAILINKKLLNSEERRKT